MKKKELYLLVTKFRKAMENANNDARFIGKMNNFPHGFCGITSNILAKYLFDNDVCDKIKYKSGMYYYGESRSNSHAWLLIYGKWIIDITGDQFQDRTDALKNDVPVYVGYSNRFYRSFNVRRSTKILKKRTKKLDTSTAHMIGMEKDIYKIVLEYLN